MQRCTFWYAKEILEWGTERGYQHWNSLRQSCFARLALTQQRAQGLADLGYIIGQLFRKERTLDCLDLIRDANT